MESRLLSRRDCHDFARKAYDLGVRYLGGCCGFEPYHIRAIAEEVGLNYESFGLQMYMQDCLPEYCT